MTTDQIRASYLEFFQAKGHAVIPRSLIVPEGDPSTLFTGSGMQPMIPYLLGEAHQNGKRLTNSQVCLRAQDIDEVGDDKHTTCFEMLGNWSLGDYFKTEQIQWIAEFLFDVVKIDPKRLYISCYIGNPEYDIPRDDAAIKLWTQEFEKRGIEAKVVELGSAENGDRLGMQGGRIFLYNGKENWWSRNGDEEGTLVGDPCGPDSEMFFDFGEEYHDENRWGKAHPANDSPRFFEIGNNVFMGYKKVAPGKFELLAEPNIDHGSGLERIAAAAIDSPDVYKISLLWPIIEQLEELSGKQYHDNLEAMRVIADHLHGAVFLAVDGVVPSNTQQGYVMRRLLRRAIRKAHKIGLTQNFFDQLVPVVSALYRETYPEIKQREDQILELLVAEEVKFRRTLERGLKEFDKVVGSRLTGAAVFTLSDTYGFPAELSDEEAAQRGIEADLSWREDFDRLMTEQKERSRTATKGQFKGGLVDHSDSSTKYHTATHLMYQALRDVLGDHVVQRGSNITPERLRFDFSHPEKVTPEQQAEVERIVNEQIKKDLIVTWSEYPTEVAIEEKHALGQFGDRYGETVKVYNMQAKDADKPFSFEICGGPHVEHTARLAEDGKRFHIIKEESSSSGIRRIKAVLQ